jgi:hypothetical protein
MDTQMDTAHTHPFVLFCHHSKKKLHVHAHAYARASAAMRGKAMARKNAREQGKVAA